MKRRSSFSPGQKKAICARAQKVNNRSSKAVPSKTKDTLADMKETIKMFEPIVSISVEEEQAVHLHFLKEPVRKKHSVEPMKRTNKKSVFLTHVKDRATEVSRSSRYQRLEGKGEDREEGRDS